MSKVWRSIFMKILVQPDNTSVQACCQCAYLSTLNNEFFRTAIRRPWEVHNRADLQRHVRWLSKRTHEWLLAFYIDREFSLIAVDAVAKGETSTVTYSVGRVISRGWSLRANGFVLVHNHPSGDPNPSRSDIAATQSLRRTSLEMDMPLLDHFIVAGDRIVPVGHW